jgi:catechol 2,3-dioxygenase
MSIDPRTTVGKVSLTVRDISRVGSFYEDVIGLEPLDDAGDRMTLGVDGRALVELLADPDAPIAPQRSTGLYHLALLVPSAAELARALQRLIEARWPLVGAADHLVSEALYLEDPEGNGIEIYRDRPHDEWRRDGDEIAMATLPLDLQQLLGQFDGAGAQVMPVGTRMGHVHLHVADLAAAERFYGDLIGLDVTARGYPGALFMSAGGYHHHIGLNTWAGEGAPPPPEGAGGLREFEIVLPTDEALEATVGRLREGGVDVAVGGGARATTRDPSENPVALTRQN